MPVQTINSIKFPKGFDIDALVCAERPADQESVHLASAMDAESYCGLPKKGGQYAIVNERFYGGYRDDEKATCPDCRLASALRRQNRIEERLWPNRSRELAERIDREDEAIDRMRERRRIEVTRHQKELADLDETIRQLERKRRDLERAVADGPTTYEAELTVCHPWDACHTPVGEMHPAGPDAVWFGDHMYCRACWDEVGADIIRAAAEQEDAATENCVLNRF